MSHATEHERLTAQQPNNTELFLCDALQTGAANDLVYGYKPAPIEPIDDAYLADWFWPVIGGFACFIVGFAAHDWIWRIAIDGAKL